MSISISLNTCFIEDIQLSINTETSVSTSWEKKLAVHTFPYTNEKIIEDNGWNHTELSLDFDLDHSIYTTDNAIRSTIKRLETLLQSNKTVMLNHPILGKVPIVCKTFSTTVPINTNYPSFSITFEIQKKDSSKVKPDFVARQSLVRLNLAYKNIATNNLITNMSNVFTLGRQALQKANNAFSDLKEGAAKGLTYKYDLRNKYLTPFLNEVALSNNELNQFKANLSESVSKVNVFINGGLQLRNKILVSPLRIRSFLGNFGFTVGTLFSLPKNIVNARFESASDVFSFVEALKQGFEDGFGSNKDTVLNSIQAIQQTVTTMKTNESNAKIVIADQPSAENDNKASLLNTNKELLYTIHAATLVVGIAELLRAEDESEEASLSSVFSEEVIDALIVTADLIVDTYQGVVPEKTLAISQEYANQLRAYKDEVEPFLYKIKEVQAYNTLITDVLYNETGSLDLLEKTLQLNNMTLPELVNGTVKIYYL